MSMVKVIVNGMDLEVRKGTPLSELLDRMEETGRSDLLVEINNRFIHEKAYGSVVVQEGDEIEIMHMAVGG